MPLLALQDQLQLTDEDFDFGPQEEILKSSSKVIYRKA